MTRRRLLEVLGSPVVHHGGAPWRCSVGAWAFRAVGDVAHWSRAGIVVTAGPGAVVFEPEWDRFYLDARASRELSEVLVLAAMASADLARGGQRSGHEQRAEVPAPR